MSYDDEELHSVHYDISFKKIIPTIIWK